MTERSGSSGSGTSDEGSAVAVEDFQTSSLPEMPALATTMSRVLVGEVARACLKSASCEGQDVTSVWAYVQCSLCEVVSGHVLIDGERTVVAASGEDLLPKFAGNGGGALFGEVADGYEGSVGDSTVSTLKS